MAEPAVKKLKDASSYDCTYTKEWADSYRAGPINGNKGAFYYISSKKCSLYTSRTWRRQTTLWWKNTPKECCCYCTKS